MKDLWEVNMKSLLVQIKNVYLLVKNVGKILINIIYISALCVCPVPREARKGH